MSPKAKDEGGGKKLRPPAAPAHPVADLLDLSSATTSPAQSRSNNHNFDSFDPFSAFAGAPGASSAPTTGASGSNAFQADFLGSNDLFSSLASSSMTNNTSRMECMEAQAQASVPSNDTSAFDLLAPPPSVPAAVPSSNAESSTDDDPFADFAGMSTTSPAANSSSSNNNNSQALGDTHATRQQSKNPVLNSSKSKGKNHLNSGMSTMDVQPAAGTSHQKEQKINLGMFPPQHRPNNNTLDGTSKNAKDTRTRNAAMDQKKKKGPSSRREKLKKSGIINLLYPPVASDEPPKENATATLAAREKSPRQQTFPTAPNNRQTGRPANRHRRREEHLNVSDEQDSDDHLEQPGAFRVGSIVEGTGRELLEDDDGSWTSSSTQQESTPPNNGDDSLLVPLAAEVVDDEQYQNYLNAPRVTATALGDEKKKEITTSKASGAALGQSAEYIGAAVGSRFGEKLGPVGFVGGALLGGHAANLATTTTNSESSVVGENIRHYVSKGKQASGRSTDSAYQFGDFTRGLLSSTRTNPTPRHS